MPAGPRVDGADVQARAAADAVERLPADLVAQHARAAVVEQHDVQLLRPVARRHARSRATCTGSSARRSRSAAAAGGRPRGRRTSAASFSIPSTVTSTGGSVVHMRPLPSDSTTTTVPVSATPKFAPLTPTFAPRGSARAGRAAPPRRGRAARRRRGRARSCARRGRGSRVRLRWIAGTRMCDDQSPSSWRISSARSVSSAWMPCRGERVVEADLVGRQRLHLDDLVGAVRAGDARRRPRSPRPRRAPSARGRRPPRPPPRTRAR